MSRATNTGEPGLGLLVIWSSEQSMRDGLLQHARTLFDVRRVHAVRWTPALVAANCARLNRAGIQPPPGPGDPGPLLVVTVFGAPSSDPVAALRQRAGAPAQVHPSLSPPAAARDLMLLLGTDPVAHLASCPGPWDGRVEEVSRDLTGAQGWSSGNELFRALDHTVRYVVLRNFEQVPESLHVGSHEDVDLLTDDYEDIVRVLNPRRHPRCIPSTGGPHWVRINGKDVWFDLRFVGDDYYDPQWARRLLDGRVWNPRGFFAPNDEDYFESLAYHTIVHKRVFAPDYGPRLAAMARAAGRAGDDAAALHDPARVKQEVDAILARRGFRYCRPRDVNVFYNFEAIGHRWPRMQRKLAGLTRKAMRVVHRLRRRSAAAPALDAR